MSFDITERMLSASLEVTLTPQLVLEIEGFPTVFGTGIIKRIIRYGDPDLEFGEGDVYGGFRALLDQLDAISFQSGTTTTIKQQLNLDKGLGESISSMTIALVDLNEKITSDLLTPDATQTPTFDILGKRCRIWYLFEDTSFKEDAIIIFRGIIQSSSSGPGLVKLQINHPDDKKRTTIFNKADAELAGLSASFDPSDVNTGADTITETAHGLINGDPISFSTTGSLPAGLASGFVVGSTANTFQVSLTVGGAAIDITSQGSGVHSYSAGAGLSRTVLNVDDTTAFLEPVTGPDALIDPSIEFYVRIDDEVIRYEAKTGVQFQTLTRGALGTTAAAHDSGASVESFIRLTGNAIDLALKLMLSGTDGPFVEDVAVTSFVNVGGIETSANSIFFQNVDVETEYGIVVGDYVTTIAAANGANNVTLQPITGVTQNDFGSFINVGGTASFILETGTSATLSFRSQYDTLGAGAAMKNDEVDIKEHLFIKRTFLSSQEYDFYLFEEIKLKEFLSEQIYNPAAAYSLPRKSQSSVGYHLAGQLPGTKTKILSTTNVTNASKLSITRSTSKNFFNAITYKYEESISEEGKFFKNLTTTDVDSLNRIEIGPKPLIIEAKGLRELLSADNLATTATSRRLKKYKFGAEFINGIKTNLKTGFDLEVGDTNVVDLTSLQISDIVSGSRAGESRIFQIVNKEFDIRKGVNTFSVVDTNFDKDIRFALIGLCSLIKTGASTTQFVIKETGNSLFGANEYRKWEGFESNLQRVGTGLRVHSADNTISGITTLKSISGNTITVEPALAFTPLADYLMEFDEYDTQINEVKLLYGFMTDAATFTDGKVQYSML